jgi:hypothetical protein
MFLFCIYRLRRTKTMIAAATNMTTMIATADANTYMSVFDAGGAAVGAVVACGSITLNVAVAGSDNIVCA